MSDDVKKFGYYGGDRPCPKCKCADIKRMYFKAKNAIDDLFDVYCDDCGYYFGHEHPADHEPATEPWEPKVGERVVDTKRNKPGFISEIHTTDEYGDKWDFDVKHDDGTENSFHVTCQWIRPETREDREKRAREIKENLKTGQRVRSIDKPHNILGAAYLDDQNAGMNATVVDLYESAALLWYDDGSTFCRYYWNLVPLPAEPEQYPCAKCGKLCSRPRSVTPFTICDECRSEPEKQRWEYVGYSIPPVGQYYVGKNGTPTRREYGDDFPPAHPILRPLPPDAEVEAMRAFCDIMVEFGFKPVMDKSIEAWQRVLDARADKEIKNDN